MILSLAIEMALIMYALLLALSLPLCYSDEPVRPLPALPLLCPNQDVCFSKLGANSTSDDSGGCCTECSCEPDCSLEGNCCFTSMDSSTDRRYQSCLSTQLKESATINKFGNAYYMINEKPEGGCVWSSLISAAHVNESCCDTGVAPWGSFMPVTSLVNGMIYKNQKFADCHGDGETLAWTAYKACDKIPSVEEDFSDCNILFINPGNKQALQNKRCFTETYRTCPANFKIKNDQLLPLSREDIIAGCESDFQSQFSVAFPVRNAYCFMCITGINPVASTVMTRYCNTKIDVRATFGETKSFISILDLNGKEPYAEDTFHPKVCDVHNTQASARCRKLLCPLGQVRASLTGRCDFAGKRWILHDYMVVVKVEFVSTVDGLSNRELVNILNSGDFIMPWRKKWKIYFVFIEYISKYQQNKEQPTLADIAFSDNLTATHFYASIVYTTDEEDPQRLLFEMKNNVNDRWMIKWRHRNISLIQSFSPKIVCHAWAFRTNGRIFQRKCAPRSRIARFENSSFLFESTNLYYILKNQTDNTENYSEEKRQTFYFSKLMLCPQVELLNGDFYFLYSDEGQPPAHNRVEPPALVLAKDGRVLFEHEFEMLTTSAGEITVRVCLEDSGFAISASSGSSRCCIGVLIGAVILTLMTLGKIV